MEVLVCVVKVALSSDARSFAASIRFAYRDEEAQDRSIASCLIYADRLDWKGSTPAL